MNPSRPLPSPFARRWWPVGLATVVALAGYFGPWTPHRAAGLIITGLDLAEYVKFIPQVMSGQVRLLREAFYLPLAAGSLIASILAGRRGLASGARLIAGWAAAPLALAMLPPAWSPGLLLQPEFRLQVLAILACLVALLLAVVTRFVPHRLALVLTAGLALAAALWPAWSYVQVLPAIRELYRTSAPLIGWGFVASIAGWVAAAMLSVVAVLRK